ncbi:organic hydroperoxide resistance protein [Mesorhizobium sp. RP14(2022)]|jgi:lipoyl-dependent peroxiredoxin|uniref:Organic hydroperoxide resistance protein n=1 Tax=Mesorhizobium liriopis TaxID=2953882 RepID=A0ABT1C2C5_9HYPH|nr:organic hydroperoxide resistance protein [Mesorhizobium liriopis]MCO6048971.1 organic hydroperoxide resistance protein [Mesorhizobium liriopis]
MKALYHAHATATGGGRTGQAKTAEGNVDVTLVTPKELGGAGGEGTNPEQLFALGYSACFLGALKHVASKEKVKLGDDVTVTATIGIGPRDDGQGFGLTAALKVNIPNVDPAVAQDLIAKADVVCPYSHLAHNGVAVDISAA